MKIEKQIADQVQDVLTIVYKRMEREYESVKQMKLKPEVNFINGYEACLWDMKIILKDEFDCEIN